MSEDPTCQHWPPLPGGAVKVAVTARLAVMARVHEPVPLQLPLQPLKVPFVTAAVSVTEVPVV